jgi:hypothetical protein
VFWAAPVERRVRDRRCPMKYLVTMPTLKDGDLKKQ